MSQDYDPDEVASIRPSVLKFAMAMEQELRANDYKGGWGDCSPRFLLQRMNEEADEVRHALDDGLARGWTREDSERIRKEAADVANFAMMIADVVCGDA
jgi:NTP pyrophosphatase (non-canonical NTP hydrolase)